MRSIPDQRKIASDLSLGSSSSALVEFAIKIIKESPLRGNLLDFGSGKGTFLRAVNTLGLFNDLSGLDLMPRPHNLEKQITWHQADLNNPELGLGKKFDIITAIEVIEHLENPRQVFRTLNKLLTKNGQLIISTPNNESIRSLISLIFRGHYVDFGESSYPAHITPLLKKDITRIAAESGFATPQFVYTSRGALPKLTRLTWQQFSCGLLGGKFFSDNLFAITRKIEETD